MTNTYTLLPIITFTTSSHSSHLSTISPLLKMKTPSLNAKYPKPVLTIRYGPYRIAQDWISERNAREVAEALAFIHTMKIGYFDLKPTNVIFVSKRIDQIKLMDFGQSRLLTPGDKIRLAYKTPDLLHQESNEKWNQDWIQLMQFNIHGFNRFIKNSTANNFKCDDCDFRFNIKQNMEYHRLIHVVEFDENKIVRWPICCCTFRPHIVFRRHILLRHLIDDDFKCVACGETFQTKSKLEIHKLLHVARFERQKLRKLKKNATSNSKNWIKFKKNIQFHFSLTRPPNQIRLKRKIYLKRLPFNWSNQKQPNQELWNQKVQNNFLGKRRQEKLKSLNSRPQVCRPPVRLDTNAVLEKLNRFKSQLNSAESKRDHLSKCSTNHATDGPKRSNPKTFMPYWEFYRKRKKSLGIITIFSLIMDSLWIPRATNSGTTIKMKPNFLLKRAPLFIFSASNNKIKASTVSVSKTHSGIPRSAVKYVLNCNQIEHGQEQNDLFIWITKFVKVLVVLKSKFLEEHQNSLFQTATEKSADWSRANNRCCRDGSKKQQNDVNCPNVNNTDDMAWSDLSE